MRKLFLTYGSDVGYASAKTMLLKWIPRDMKVDVLKQKQTELNSIPKIVD